MSLKTLKERSENNQNHQFFEAMLSYYLSMLEGQEQFTDNPRQKTRNTVLELISKG